mmetsp:Transcript_34024/g.41961  ORF Transcript_34024/g.41961 Transcript_34024/m.41961 type:complete len:216 (-) Transcript_34024:1102-1749(-)
MVEDPLAELLFLIACSDIEGVGLLSFFDHVLRLHRDVSSVELGRDQVNFVAIGDGQETGVHDWAPFDLVDDFALQFVLAHDLARAGVPNDTVVILVGRGKVEAVWADGNRTHRACVEIEFDRDLHREGFEVIWRGQLRDELAGVGQVDLFAQESRAQVEIQTALEVLTNEILIERHFPERFKLLGHIIELAVLFVLLLPFLLLLVIVKELLGRVE